MIRPWKREDIPFIEEMEKLCFSDPWNGDMIRSSFEGNGFYGLIDEDNGEIRGYIAASFIFDEADILIVATKEEYRKKGIATALLEETERALKERGVGKIFLEVRESNIPARNCYEKNGFEAVGTRASYYGNGENAIVMEKLL